RLDIADELAGGDEECGAIPGPLRSGQFHGSGRAEQIVPAAAVPGDEREAVVIAVLGDVGDVFARSPDRGDEVARSGSELAQLTAAPVQRVDVEAVARSRGQGPALECDANAF